VVRVGRESRHLGGAGNVVHNIISLGGRAWPVGVSGTGQNAARLREALAAVDAPSEGVLRLEKRATTVKTRIVAHSQQVVRFDQEQDDPLSDEEADRLARAAMDLIGTAHALVISDYEKGCVTPAVLARVLPAAADRGIPVVVDPKPLHWMSYKPITTITPNQSEAARMSGLRVRGAEDAEAAARAIRDTLDCDGVLLTRGEAGMLLVPRKGSPVTIAATSREVYDVTGAGDTVVATLALLLAGGASLQEAAEVANAAAGVVVGKVGTATATPAETAAAFSRGR
jgi:D-beta-D-heptose 7-phosphate kinase/D-beta-D-heptose 1-phosphate adenosyltransferase